MKVVTATSLPKHSSILFDTETYANFLRFYDGICEWEEDSPTPVLHTVWAKQLVYSLSKFDPRVRHCIQIHAEGEEEESSSDSDGSDSDKSDEGENKTVTETTAKEKEWKGGRRKKRKPTKSLSETNGFTDQKEETSPKVNGSTEEEDQIKTAIEELVSKVGEDSQDSQSETPNPNIAELAQACSESILNRDYLLSGGEPFTTSATTTTSVITSTYEARVDVNEFLSSKSNGTQFVGMTVDSMLKAESPADMMMFRKQPDSAPAADEPHVGLSSAELKEEEAEDVKEEKEEEKFEPISAELNLYSQKMKGLRKLLSSEKLNTSAIMLQLTAQSQTHFKHNKRGSGMDMGYSLPRKRTRREIS